MTTDPELDAIRDAAIADPDVPEVVRRFLGAGAKLDALRLSSLGVWTFNGAPVEHPRVCALFSRSLQRTNKGTWVLSIPPYTYPVIVEGAGWFIRRVRLADGHAAEGETTGGERVAVDLRTLETDGDTYLGVRLDSRRRARLIGPAYATLAEHIDVSDDGGWVLDRGGAALPIAVIGDASEPLPGD